MVIIGLGISFLLCLVCVTVLFLCQEFAVWIFRECLLSVASFTDLFGGHVEERLLFNVEMWERR